MTTQFTPGEWHANDNQIYPVTGSGDGATIAYCYPQKNDEEQKANAKLIAASPDMLAALNAISEACLCIPKETFTAAGLSNFKEILSQVDSAISKAIHP